MPTTNPVAEEGVVELGERTYRYLVNALHTIAEGNDACCSGLGRSGSGHDPLCPVAIARKAMRDARRASDAFGRRRPA